MEELESIDAAELSQDGRIVAHGAAPERLRVGVGDETEHQSRRVHRALREWAGDDEAGGNTVRLAIEDEHYAAREDGIGVLRRRRDEQRARTELGYRCERRRSDKQC